jgi:hypothetical protein
VSDGAESEKDKVRDNDTGKKDTRTNSTARPNNTEICPSIHVRPSRDNIKGGGEAD